MDDRKPPISHSTPCGKTDADAAPIDSARQSSSVVQGSSVVYFCSAEEVSEGFAIALRAMGFDEILLSDLVAQPPTSSNPEDN
ncbi:MAG TPA: hypothetical protein VMT08_16510 [Bradyrhizobium sp.]|nr:hypothetical protein [Bradyrhizobium sp.]